jgi:hypothetical protein
MCPVVTVVLYLSLVSAIKGPARKSNERPNRNQFGRNGAFREAAHSHWSSWPCLSDRVHASMASEAVIRLCAMMVEDDTIAAHVVKTNYP